MSSFTPFRFFNRVTKWFALAAALAATVGVPYAQDDDDTPVAGGGNKVIYTPNAVATINITIGGSWYYDLAIKSPANLPVGLTPVTLVGAANSTPSGLPILTALTFVTFDTPIIVFTGPSQTRVVRVTFTLPPTAPAGNYQYFLKGIGWPLTASDPGTSINAVAVDSASLELPTVSINSPGDGSNYNYTFGAPALAIPVSISAAGKEAAPILTLRAYLSAEEDGEQFMDAVPLTLAYTGMGTPSAAATTTISVSRPGIYTIAAYTDNRIGPNTTSSEFTVNQVFPPPIVQITEPPAATYTYYAGSPALQIPFTFQGTSLEGGIRELRAWLNGTPVNFESADIGALVATGSGTFTLSNAGSYTLTVMAIDDHGDDTTATSFTINVVNATPTIVINDPVNGTVLEKVAGGSNLNVPFTFTISTDENFTISTVSAKLNGSTQALGTITGLNTEQAVVTGTMTNLPAGQYTLTAFGTSSGVQVSTSVTFTIKEISPVSTPPTVTINSPAVGSVYTLVKSGSCGGTSSLTVPLNFTGRSTSSGAVITNLTATLNGSAVSVTKANLYSATATGTASLVVSSTGTYTVKVTATDKYGTATATTTFSVVSSNTKVRVSGNVFFDVIGNGARDSADYGLSGISVKILSSGQTVSTATSDSSGNYSFSVSPGSYTISVVVPRGYSVSTANNHPITVATSAVTAPATGLTLNFASIRGMCANGFTIGYWKNNIDKALSCKKNGAQVSASALNSYTTVIRGLALDPFSNMTLSLANSTMASTSSQPADLLAKQLIASEYNYANGAYLNKDRTLTYAFIYYGEYVLKNKSSYSSTALIFTKDWFDAYNNSHGGAVMGPL